MEEKLIRSIEKIDSVRADQLLWLSQFTGEDGVIRSDYLMQITCPCCGKNNNKEFLIKNGFRIVQCNNCETYFVNPILDSKILAKFYQDPKSRGKYLSFLNSGTDSMARVKQIFLPRCEKIAKAINKKGEILTDIKLLDIGCASGDFLSSFNSNNSPILYGIEVSHELAAVAQDKLPKAVIVNQPFENCEFDEDFFDIVTAWEVLEHILNPYQFLREVRRILKPGGFLFVTVPNMQGFDVQILWDINFAFDPPAHLNYFRKSTIHLLFERAGLIVNEITTPGKLDIDIVRNRMHQSPDIVIRLGEYWAEMLMDESNEGSIFRSRLQSFLSETASSGHMMLVCNKPL